MTLDTLIDYLEQCRSDFGGDTVVVLTADDFIEEGEFIALDQIPLED